MDPAEKSDKVIHHVRNIRKVTVVSGTYGILSWSNTIKFFTLGSVSRGIPRREWEISFLALNISTFTFCPQANVVATANGLGRT